MQNHLKSSRTILANLLTRSWTPATILRVPVRGKKMGRLRWLSPLPKSCSSPLFNLELALFSGLLLWLAPPVLSAQNVSFAGSSPSVNFGNVNVCPAGKSSPAPCTETLTLTYNVTVSGTLGATRVLTGGTPNLDFTLAGGSTCTGTVFAGHTCTVNVNFGPKYPGARRGGVQITDKSGDVLTTTLVYGVGLGPQAGFNLGNPIGVALQGVLPSFSHLTSDSAGNFYAFGPSSTNPGAPMALIKLPIGGGPQVSVPLTMNGSEIAIDGAGDLFLLASSSVYELPAGGGIPIKLPFTGLSSSNEPLGIAVDSAGDVFVVASDSEGLHASVLELPAGGASQITLPFSGLDSPSNVAVDNAGDVFVSETPTAQSGEGSC
jgi:hypothetical protein